jgi:hypothetical protein
MLKRISVTLLLLIVGMAILISVRVQLSRHKAEGFLRESGRFTVGKTTYEEAEVVLAPYRHNLSYSDRCTPQHCLILFVFKNTWFRILHLSPATDFGGTLVFENDILSARITFLEQDHCCTGHITEGILFSDPADPASPDFSITFEKDEHGQPQKANVQLTPKATDQQRRRAYDLNLDCLSRFGGCRAEELIPAIWAKK